MKRFVILIILAILLTNPAHALDLTAPPVPEHAEKFMPASQASFTEDFFRILRDALMYFRPDFKEAAKVCMSIIAIAMGSSLLSSFPDTSTRSIDLSSGIAIALVLLKSTGSLVNLAVDTVREFSEYGKLLLPVLTAAMAGQGNISSSAALYAATALFDSVLTSLIGRVLTPLVYLFLALAIACGALQQDMLKKMRDCLKRSIIWLLKTILYVYTGFITISGVVSGATDAATLKAAKLTISSVVPVVGGILSDASEAILVSAATVKNAAGVYGMFAVLAIWIGPFLKTGAHYLLLKATGGICGTFANRASTELIQDFSTAQGLLLAMTGADCLLLLISLVCFMRSVVA